MSALNCFEMFSLYTDVVLLGFLMRVAGMMVITTLPVIQRERIVLAVPLQPLAKKVLIQ